MTETTGACDVTIAICTYNRIETIRRTLLSLGQLRGPYTFEVIVVNGPSTDGTGAFLETCEGIRVFDNPEQNLSMSRNIAIANAAGEFIAFLDDDAIAEPDWLTLLCDRFRQDPGVSALGGFIRDSNGIEFQAKYVYCDLFGRGYPCDNLDYAKFLAPEKELFLSLTGTNVAFRTRDVRAIGGFDEVFAYFLDETDVNKRMLDAGMALDVVPEAEIHHKYAPSHLRKKDKTATNMFPVARSVAYFAARHGAKSLGWLATSQYLKDFYTKEFEWKTNAVVASQMAPTECRTLLGQTLSGIIAGVDRHFDGPPADIDTRVVKHQVPDSAPIIRRMRAPDDMLRLCMFSQDHGRSRPAGIGLWSNLVAKGLVERGHEVTLIGHLQEDAQREYVDFTADGYWSHNLSHFERETGNETECLGLPEAVAVTAKRKYSELLRVNKHRDFQLVSSPIWDVEGAAAIAAGRFPNVLSLHTCVGLMLDAKTEWRENEDFYQYHILKLINAEIQALKRCDLILANSEAIVRDISRVYDIDLSQRPLAIVPHGIEDIPAERIRDRSAPADVTRILFLGRIEVRKGIDALARTLTELMASREDVVVDIVGGQVDAAQFRRVQDLLERFPGRVTYHGFLDDDQVADLMEQADIFFAPSLYESFGLIYVEAMRFGLPCLGFATGGVTEVITHGEDGLLAPLGDEKQLFAHLCALVDNPETRARLSVGARRSFESKFLYGLMAERLEEAYRSVLPAPGS